MGEMADFFLFSHYDVDNFDDDAMSNYYRRRYHYNTRHYDPTYYSRRAAVCERCGAKYENLYRSIADTAKAARNDGWQIEHNTKGYEWYCSDCKAAHDFESVINSEENTIDENTKQPTNAIRWEHLGGDEWCCPRCAFVITTEGSWEYPTDKYCRECGQKMDVDTDNEDY